MLNHLSVFIVDLFYYYLLLYEEDSMISVELCNDVWCACFISTSNKLKSLERGEPQLGKCFHKIKIQPIGHVLN